MRRVSDEPRDAATLFELYKITFVCVVQNGHGMPKRVAQRPALGAGVVSIFTNPSKELRFGPRCCNILKWRRAGSSLHVSRYPEVEAGFSTLLSPGNLIGYFSDVPEVFV